MSLDNLRVLIYINMCCILPNDLQIENEGYLFSLIFQYRLYGIL